MRRSAGILLYRRRPGGAEVLLVHPGGPFWAGKDARAWSMPKGEFGPDEEALAAACREFTEETGCVVPAGAPHPLGTLKAGGKEIHAFALEGDWDPAGLTSNSFAMEWPPGSGRIRDFPEVDRAGWFDLATARGKLHGNQVAFLDRLEALLGSGTPP